MGKINNIFDYIYYRLNKFYYKWDGYNGIRSFIALSMFQTLIISNVAGIILKIIFTKEEIRNLPHFAPIVIGIFIALEVYNYFRYKGKYSTLKERWKDETKKQSVQRGLLVILALALPMVLIVLLTKL